MTDPNTTNPRPNWLARNADAVEAGAAAVTAVTAILALAGIALQLRAADDTSRAQSAREAYANHLALAVGNPDFAAPPNACAILASTKGPAYRAYVDYLLYAAEQMVTVEDGWDATFAESLTAHQSLICTEPNLASDTPALQPLISQFVTTTCPAVLPCQSGT
jgi:hypothetical protein